MGEDLQESSGCNLRKKGLPCVQSFSFLGQKVQKIDVQMVTKITLWSRALYFLLLSICKVAVSLNHQSVWFLHEYLRIRLLLFTLRWLKHVGACLSFPEHSWGKPIATTQVTVNSLQLKSLRSKCALHCMLFYCVKSIHLEADYSEGWDWWQFVQHAETVYLECSAVLC